MTFCSAEWCEWNEDGLCEEAMLDENGVCIHASRRPETEEEE